MPLMANLPFHWGKDNKDTLFPPIYCIIYF